MSGQGTMSFGLNIILFSALFILVASKKQPIKKREPSPAAILCQHGDEGEDIEPHCVFNSENPRSGLKRNTSLFFGNDMIVECMECTVKRT